MRRLAPALGCALAFLLVPAQAQILEVPTLEAPSSLDVPWRFQAGDDPTWARPDFDDSAWPWIDISRPWGLQGQSNTSAFCWYRLALHLPNEGPPEDRRLAVRMGRFISAYELHAGGRLLGGVGALPPHPREDYDRQRIYAIPASAVEPSGRLVLAVRVWRNPALPWPVGGSDGGVFQVGRVEDLTRQQLVDDMPFVVLGFVFIVAALYHAALFRRRTERAEYLWFSLLTLDAAVYILLRTQWKYLVTDRFVPLKELEYLVLYLMPAINIQFLWTALDKPIPRWLRAFQWSLVALAAVVVFTPGLALNLWTLRPWQVWILIGMVAALVTLVQSIRRRHPEALTIGLGSLVMVFIYLIDSFGEWLALGWPRYIHFGFAVYLFSMAASLSNRFNRVHGELDALNQELERRVEARTLELRREQQRTEEALREAERERLIAVAAQAEADEANRAKSRFLATMSHELRTPLNAILGFVQVMQRRAGRDGQDSDHLGIISRSGAHLLGLINDILNLAKIEAGLMTLNTGVFDLRRLVASVEEMFRASALARGLTLTTEAAPGLPEYVSADEGKLRQILINLVGNAVKFTRTGGVTLRASWVEDRGVFEVEDTGPGLTADEVSRLFVAFTQTEAGRRSAEGTGLGLALGRSHARLMGGDLTVTSEPGRGATFRLEVALPPAEGAQGRSRRRVRWLWPGTPRFSILICDDAADNRRLVVELLEPVGFEVREAADGRAALLAFEHDAPDLVLLDKNMPVLDGFEVIRAIRAAEAEEGETHVPVIAFSASALDHEQSALLQAGCDEFLAKPFLEADLFAAIARRLRVRYVYEDERMEPLPADVEVSRERLGALPETWLARFRVEVQEGNGAGALGLVDEIEPLDAVLAASLRARIKAYRLDDIEDALE